MSIQLRAKKVNSIMSTYDSIPRYKRYNLELELSYLSGTSYNTEDLKIRLFYNHHFLMTPSGGFGNRNNTQFSLGLSTITTTSKTHNWRSDTRPPRLDINKFCSELEIRFSNGVLNGVNSTLAGGVLGIAGYDIDDLVDTTGGLEESYSYISSTSFVTNPSNIVVEQRDNTKTKYINIISVSNDVVTVLTTSPHNLSIGQSVSINGVTEVNGSVFNGTFIITEVVDTQTFTYITKSNVKTSVSRGGVIEVWNILLGEVPSRSVGANYAITPSINDYHTLTHKLLYPIKDTCIELNTEIDYKKSKSIPISKNDIVLSGFNFTSLDITNITNCDLCYYIDYTVPNQQSIQVSTIDNVSWGENVSYEQIYSYLNAGDLLVTSINKENKEKHKFIKLPLNISTLMNLGNKPSIAVSTLNNDDSYLTLATIDNKDPLIGAWKKPYIVLWGDVANVVSDLPIVFDNSTIMTGNVGDIVTIYISQGTFNNDPYKNEVRIGNVICPVFNVSNTSITIQIPPYSVSNTINIQTNTDLVNNELTTPVFTVVYEDIDFDVSDSIISKTKNEDRIFGNVSGNALYNRDFSYSGFAEVTDENSLLQNVYAILLTANNERLNDPNFGLTLDTFKLIDDPIVYQGKLLEDIIHKINTYEPRVSVDPENSYTTVIPDENSVFVVITLFMPSGNVREIGVSLNIAQG